MFNSLNDEIKKQEAVEPLSTTAILWARCCAACQE
jgi:hypothetical protein